MLAALTPAAPDPAAGALLEVDHLKTYFPVHHGALAGSAGVVRAVDDVSFHIRRGETFGLVGESGCGKSTIVRTILRLVAAHSGTIRFEGSDILAMPPREFRRTRPSIQAIFQDPRGSLDPRMTAGDLIAEGLVVQHQLTRRERQERVRDLTGLVGLRPEQLGRYPHEFSGGQQQRIGIARALALRPKLVVADEPVSALDVSVQSQVLNLLTDLQQELGLTYLFIAHNLSVVEYISDRVGVMYLGQLVEVAPAQELYENPRMPYTQALISAIPGRGKAGRERIVLRGDVPSPASVPSGCRFRGRCWRAEDICAEASPPLREITSGHWAACHFADQ
jgi:oligopeptide/dipeptide ABC transporter ATP-binding protein